MTDTVDSIKSALSHSKQVKFRAGVNAARAMAATAIRRLAAILAADVAGYSRLMGADEEGTHERLQAHLRELVTPKIAEHRGRIVKNTGDGFLAEFPSVVDAVRCAVEIQRGMAVREPEVPEERRIRLRMGINLGDVIAEEHDIFGDGVNVAARLEAQAEPGGICVSGTVRPARAALPQEWWARLRPVLRFRPPHESRLALVGCRLVRLLRGATACFEPGVFRVRLRFKRP